MHDVRVPFLNYRRLATFYEAEIDLNRVYVGSTNCWQPRRWRRVHCQRAQTGDRTDDEHEYLQKATKIMEMVQSEGGWVRDRSYRK